MPKQKPEGSTTSTPTQSDRQYGRGYVPDPDAVKLTEYRDLQRHLGAAGRLARTALRLREIVDGLGIENQGRSGSCVGQAKSKSINTRMSAIGKPIAKVSAKGVYDLARMFGKSAPEDELVDEGCKPHLADRGMNKIGVPFEEDWPTDLAHINKEPPLDVLIACSKYEVEGSYIIYADREHKITEMQNALSQDIPLTVAIPADDAFDGNKGEVIEKFDPKVEWSNHLTLCCGYETLPSGELVFWFANSWSRQWGENGFFKVSAECMMDPRIDAVTAMAVVPKTKKASES